MWTSIKEKNTTKSSNEFAKADGDSNTFEQTTKLCMPNIKDKEVIFNKFVQVLTTFKSKDGESLISYERA